jgi:CheY-like chemotaxis protein/HPt (histidine-containing phosphotransfer) domain-containing protein
MKTNNSSKTRSEIKLPEIREFNIPADAKDFLNDFIESTASQLEELEAAALACEKGLNCSENIALARRITHTIKGNAGIIGMNSIYEFCHQAETAIHGLEAGKLPDLLLDIKDQLQAALKHLTGNNAQDAQPCNIEKNLKARCLIVEDELVCQTLLMKYLSDFYDCDIAVNGNEAISAFESALSENRPYDLICLDIMMPEMNGHQALEAIRRIETSFGIGGLDHVKVIMTTALGDSKNVMTAFKEGCESYIVKPINKQKLFEEIEKLGLNLVKA